MYTEQLCTLEIPILLLQDWHEFGPVKSNKTSALRRVSFGWIKHTNKKIILLVKLQYIDLHWVRFSEIKQNLSTSTYTERFPQNRVQYKQWCIVKNGGGYTQTGAAKGLKVPCLFMIAEVSIRCQKKPGGWYTPYTRVYPPIHHWL